MHALFVLVCVLVPLAAYLAIGKYLTRRRLPYIWKQARLRYVGREVQSSVNTRVFYMVVFWPLLVPFISANSSGVGWIERGDPEYTQRLELEVERMRLHHENASIGSRR